MAEIFSCIFNMQIFPSEFLNMVLRKKDFSMDVFDDIVLSLRNRRTVSKKREHFGDILEIFWLTFEFLELKLIIEFLLMQLKFQVYLMFLTWNLLIFEK